MSVTVDGAAVTADQFAYDAAAQTVTLGKEFTGAHNVVVSYKVDQVDSKLGLNPNERTAFRITIEGGAQFNVLNQLKATLEGQIILTIVVDTQAQPTHVRIDLDFSVNLEVTFLGQLGRAAGHFVVDVGASFALWGAMRVETGDGLKKLEEVGLYLQGSAVLEINTTSTQKSVNIKLPKPGATLPYDASELGLRPST